MSLNRVIDESLEEHLGDRPCSVQLSQPERLGNGFRNYDRFSVMRRDRVGEVVSFHREVLRSGAVVGVLPIDFERQEIVLTRQFRLGGHLAANRGEMVEIVAGRVDGDERPEEAARRECFEETGAQPLQLRRLFDFAPAPALSDEFMTLFLAVVDASQTSIWAGMPHENEEIAVARYSFAEAICVSRRWSAVQWSHHCRTAVVRPEFGIAAATVLTSLTVQSSCIAKLSRAPVDLLSRRSPRTRSVRTEGPMRS